MRLGEFKRQKVGEMTRYAAPVADISGAADYELVLAGPAKSVERVFKDSDFQVTIDPTRSFEEGVERELRGSAETQLRDFNQMASLEQPAELPLFKKLPPSPDPAKSVFVSLRRLRGEGTFWGPWTFPYILPLNWSIWVWPPPLCTLTACVTPVSGDQDIFLFRNGIFPALIAASVKGGTATDCVTFSNPPLTGCSVFTWNFLLLRLFGFRTGIGTFMMRGFS
jgi:hypothetical protein